MEELTPEQQRKLFEDEVRRIARHLWPEAEFCGAAHIAGRERDGVFITAEEVHIIECTVSKGRDKAIQDVKKLVEAIRHWEKREPMKSPKGWFITKEEPTDLQREVVNCCKARVVAASFDQFRAKLVDAKTYLELRKNYAFGSVRDPETNHAIIDLDYEEMSLVGLGGDLYTVDGLLRLLLPEGQPSGKFVVLGDYGAGKSSTMREFFLRLRKLYFENRTAKFPILLNLNDHQGEDDPVEALARHAQKIGFGFDRGAELVSAWRGGYAVLLLDGFDEIIATGMSARTKKLREVRRQSMTLLRNFVQQTPPEAGIVIAGRKHFFDNPIEMSAALGLDTSFKNLDLDDFSDEQVKRYLKKRGWNETIPEWVPARPLLLGYLASKSLLRQIVEGQAGSAPAAGWHGLLTKISAREAERSRVVDADSVRQLLERLATLARNSTSGLGELLPDQLVKAFADICGYAPEDTGLQLLQRLPGLGVNNPEDGSRKFIEQDLVSAAAAGDVYRFISDPHGAALDSSGWQSSISPLGVQVIALRCNESHFTGKQLSAAAKNAADGTGQHTLCVDIVRTLLELKLPYEGPQLFIQGVEIPEMPFDESSGDLSAVHFQRVLFVSAEFAPELNDSRLPEFTDCDFITVAGRTGRADLPPRVMSSCNVEQFDDSAVNTSAILKMPVSLGARVLLTILKKLYVQKGRGRQEAAFFRGLDYRAQALVPEVLDLLKHEGFVSQAHYTGQTVWLPNRSASHRSRARMILAAPNECQDSLMIEAARI